MKICLIGNNLTSLILANILSKKNIYCEIYYIKSIKNNLNTRTLGISDNNLKYLLNYFKNILNKTNPINEIHVFVKNEKINKKVSFNKSSKTLFNMIDYNQLVSFVKSKISKNKYISQIKLNKHSDYMHLIKNKKFNLVINCERENILTSKFLKKGIFKDYNSTAYTTIINHKKIKKNLAIQIFTKYGPIAYLPLSDKHSSVVFSYYNSKRKKLTENQIINIIKEFNPIFKIKSHIKFESFKLSLKFPKKYYSDNILFFGDSIHSIHPLAGQGFNMTLRDIIRLNKIIDQKINIGLSIDENICKEFEDQTKSYNSAFSLGIDLVHEFFKFNNDYLPIIISEKIFQYVDKNKGLKDLGIKLVN